MSLSVHVKKALKLADPEATKARLSEGRQWIGIKNLEAPDEVQPRAGIDKDWVSQLATFRREGSEFPPARVYQLPNAQLILAEGHHRRWALLGENETDMLCDVVDGTMEEAIVYAAGSNKSNGVKPMSPHDITRAVEMILAIESWWNRSNAVIGRRIGCKGTKVGRIRKQLAESKGLSIPDHVIREDGAITTYGGRRSNREAMPSISRHGNKVRCLYKNEWHSASTIDELHKIMNGVFSQEEKRKRSLKPSNLYQFMKDSGFEMVKWTSFWGSSDIQATQLKVWVKNDVVATSCDFSSPEKCLVGLGILELVSLNVGRLKLAKNHVEAIRRQVIMSYKGDCAPKLIGLCEKVGIEFMTPDELIASLGPVIPEELKSDL